MSEANTGRMVGQATGVAVGASLFLLSSKREERLVMLKLIRAAAILSCVSFAFAASHASAQNDAGELTYINCEAGFGIIFPSPPMTGDVQFTTNTGRSVPARQFYLQRGQDLLQVTVARFNYGPPIDEAAMDHAAAGLKARGEVRYEAAGAYDPGYPGRQLNIFIPGDRQLRASVYMMEHKLYIIEGLGAVGDFAALQFEQSITMVNEMGVDYDQNPPDPIHKLRRLATITATFPVCEA